MAGALLMCGMAACNKDFLDKKPLDQFSEQDVWKDQGLIQAFVNDMYAQMRPGFGEVMLSSMSDESRFIHDYNTSRVVQGNVTPDDFGALGDFSRWGGHYKVIRNCNMFFEKIDSVKGINPDALKRMKGEVHFMRAWYYHMLVKYFGGVPLITYTFNLNGEHSDYGNVRRASFSRCVDFIGQECDSAAALLPDSYSDIGSKGRLTRAAAFALKSRMMLYAASASFNTGADTLMGNGSNKTVQYATLARAAADSIIRMGRYALYHPTDSAADNYARVFLDKDNVEMIFVKLYDKALLGTRHDLYNGPNGYHNWGGNVPLENFVTGYQMKDGTPFSWNDPAKAKAPYANRDPRFYATILYDGAKWKARPADAAQADPVGIIQTGKYESPNGKDSIWGLDTRNSTIENWNGTFSGYYIRKFMDKTLDAQFFSGDQSWIFFRYAEVLLNYAEASLLLGDEANAITRINQVRTRAGMPATTATGAALWDIYRYERRYELAFEEHRFFDVRRWNGSAFLFNQPAQGIEVLGSMVAGHPFVYHVFNMQDRSYDSSKYLLPIPVAEIRKNSNLDQNAPYK